MMSEVLKCQSLSFVLVIYLLYAFSCVQFLLTDQPRTSFKSLSSSPSRGLLWVIFVTRPVENLELFILPRRSVRCEQLLPVQGTKGKRGGTLIPLYGRILTKFTRRVSFLQLSPGQTITTFQRNIAQHCWPSICKARPNNRNISTQHIATLCAACCARLTTLLRRVATCWVLQIVQVRIPQRKIVARTCNIHKCCMENLTIFKREPTTPNMSQHVATGLPNAMRNVTICCVEILQSFGRSFKLIHKFTNSSHFSFNSFHVSLTSFCPHHARRINPCYPPSCVLVASV